MPHLNMQVSQSTNAMKRANNDIPALWKPGFYYELSRGEPFRSSQTYKSLWLKLNTPFFRNNGGTELRARRAREAEPAYHKYRGRKDRSRYSSIGLP